MERNYTWISNANYVISAEKTMTGSEVDVDYVLGNAYAIRALSYFNLANWFARPPYSALQEKFRWSDPCVPIYTEPTGKDFVGKKRENLETVFAQINSDLDTAIDLLEKVTRLSSEVQNPIFPIMSPSASRLV